MTTDVSFMFTTRDEDVMKPRVLEYYPKTTGISRSLLDGTTQVPLPATTYPQVPYVLFTEGVSLGKDQVITIYESGGGNKYNITASDSTCYNSDTAVNPC